MLKHRISDLPIVDGSFKLVRRQRTISAVEHRLKQLFHTVHYAIGQFTRDDDFGASGAIWGAMFIQFVPNIADQISKAAPWAIYGVFLIVFMYLMPGGVAGLIQVLRARFGAARR